MDKEPIVEIRNITSQLFERILSGAASEVISLEKESSRTLVDNALKMVEEHKKHFNVRVSCHKLQTIFDLLYLMATETHNKINEEFQTSNDDRIVKIMTLLNKKYDAFIKQKNVIYFDSRLQDYLASVKKYLAIKLCLIIEDFENVSTFFCREDFMTLRPYTDLYVMVICSDKSISQLEEENYGGEYMENQFESFVI